MPYFPSPSIVPPLWVNLPFVFVPSIPTSIVKLAVDVILPDVLVDLSSIVTSSVILIILLPRSIVWPFKSRLTFLFINSEDVTITSFSSLMLPPIAIALSKDIVP